MSAITDTNDVPVTYLNFSQQESSDSAVFTLKVPCKTGQELKADTNATVSIFGRPAGVGSYVNLNSSPISLTPYAGTNQAFDLFVRTGAVSGLISTAVALRAAYP